jgi:S-adenosylmethionine:tRNA ribosyltransferase-isomerase
MFRAVTQILKAGDLLVLNNTRVTARRLFGQKPTGAAVELLVLRKSGPNRFESLVKPGKRLQPGAKVLLDHGMVATIETSIGEGLRELSFAGQIPAEELLNSAGSVPLPPYIHETLRDDERYQTVYASTPGSSAAPTAGLHFTSLILEELRTAGIEVAFVTLDVGIDTFRPVTAENLDDHKMHGETCSVPPETAAVIDGCQGRIVAVGTTTVRTLESFAIGPRKVATGTRTTDIFIRPGYEFKIVDGMFTNFHMPRTTMLVMLSTMIGRERLMSAYQEALDHGYRFLSFGDSMLLL